MVQLGKHKTPRVKLLIRLSKKLLRAGVLTGDIKILRAVG
jgi:hypothetical protein